MSLAVSSVTMASFNSNAPILDTYQAVVSAYTEFLTVAIHTILFERNIYPEDSFIRARKYNYPVRQNRHPRLCNWIMDAVAAVEVEMLKVRMHCKRFILFLKPPSLCLHKIHMSIIEKGACPSLSLSWY